MTKWKKSVGFMVAAEFTVAAHVLLFLPPAAQAATPVPVEAKVSGEAALAMLQVAEPAPQETVTVNKTVPDVEPPPQYPTFSAIPTDEELFKARVFGEPLIPENGETNDSENQALAQAITTYLYGGDSEALEPLEGVVTAFPFSRWRVAVQANVGSWYRKKGYFSRAQRNLAEAWQLGKSSDTEGVRRLAEFAAGELMQIHMQFGQVDPLEALVTDFEGRELSGGITEKLAAARATVWGLRNDHGSAIPSGSVALERIRKNKHDKAEKVKKDKDPKYKKKPSKRHTQLDAFPATHDGASLAEIQELADLTDLKLQMARRQDPAAVIPTPSLVHLKQGHFSALVEERDGRFRFDDPLLGGEVWMSREAFEEGISGYFLIEQGRLPAGWTSAFRSEMEPVRGKCVYAFWGLGGDKKTDVSGASCPRGAGMAWFTFHTMLASLSIVDNPVGYSPPLGPSARFVMTYNQREAGQPSTFYFSNLGARWSHNWLSYIEDDPTNVGDPVVLHAAGGGYEDYNGFVNDVSAPQQDTRAVVSIVSTSPIKYERQFSDGSKEIFGQSDGASVSPRRIFLTKKHDAQGNKITLTYDSDLRLVSVTDAIGQVTSFSYGLATDPLKITKVTDPFERTATFEYNDDGQLVRITDAIGLTSEFEYGSADFVRGLTTGYGTTTFRHGVGPYNTLTNRWLEATDPLGGTQRVEQLLNSAPVPTSDSASTVPTGFSGNVSLNTHLSVYYSKLQMHRATSDPPDPETGTITRWRSSDSLTVSGYQVQSVKEPLESRVWYEHAGEAFVNGTGADGRPSVVGRVLDDGSSQLYRYEHNSLGKITHYQDRLGRESSYEYDTNDVDLITVRQKNGADWDLLATIDYNTPHRPTTIDYPSGASTSYSYAADGQVTNLTKYPADGVGEGHTWTYAYDTAGRLLSMTKPGGASASWTYDSAGRVRTRTPIDGFTTTIDYDELDRTTRITLPGGEYTEVGYELLHRASSRDLAGRMEREHHDPLRRILLRRDASGRTTQWVWCPCGTLDAIVDANGHSARREYDIQGRLTKEIREDSTERSLVYDSAGRLITHTDAEDQVTEFEYALDDALLSRSYTDELYTTADVSFSYADPSSGSLDPYGRLRQAVDGSGTTTFEYQPMDSWGAGNIKSIDGPLTNDTIEVSYDRFGRHASQTLNGNVTTTTYDEYGRVSSIVDSIGTFEFDYVGDTSQLQTIHYPNGQTSSYTYLPDTERQLLEQIHHRKPDGSTLLKFDYVYDAAGNITTWTHQDGADPAKAYDLSYDRSDQLRRAVWRTTADPPTILKRYAYAYDPAGNRTVEQIDNAPVFSIFDELNRLQEQKPGGSIRFAGEIDEAATVQVDGLPASTTDDNRFERDVPISVGAGTSSIKVVARDYSGNERTNTYEVTTAGATTTFDYDANGNVASMTSAGTTTDYDWDAAGSLARAAQGVSELATFTYDAFGRRKTKVAGGATLNYVSYDNHVLEERVAGGTTTRFVYGPWIDRPLASVASGAVSYYVSDHLGSVRSVTDATGDVSLARKYDLFGNPISGSSTSGIAFTGREWDAETSLYYYRARYYDPTTARFLSQDPVGATQGRNLYPYVNNRPLLLVDPSGAVPDLNLFHPDDEAHDIAEELIDDGVYTVAGHGGWWPAAAEYVADNRPSTGPRSLDEKALSNIITGDPKWGGRDVKLYACAAGTDRAGGRLSYAQELANLLCVTVKAPDGNLEFGFWQLPSRPGVRIPGSPSWIKLLQGSWRDFPPF